MKRVLASATGVAIVLMAMSGCMRVVYDITLHPDNTASGDLVVAVQESALDTSGMTPEELFTEELLADFISGLDNTVVTDYNEGGYVGRLVTFDGQVIDELRASGSNGFSRDGDEFVFRVSALSGDDIGSLEALAGRPEYADPEIRWAVTFPGVVSEHNGSLSGTTVTWDTDALLSSDEAYARGSAIAAKGAPGSPGPDDRFTVDLGMWIVVGALVLAALGLVWYRRTRSNAEG